MSLSGFANKIICMFIVCPLRATSITNLISVLIFLLTLVIFSEVYTVRSCLPPASRFFLFLRYKFFLGGAESTSVSVRMQLNSIYDIELRVSACLRSSPRSQLVFKV
jgi:hypothetical protein